MGPHGQTSRFAYTVPTGRKANVQCLQASYMKITVSAPAGKVNMQIQVGLNATPLWLDTGVNTVLGVERTTITDGNVINAGIVIQSSTTDPSTGGTGSAQMSIDITEFDA